MGARKETHVLPSSRAIREYYANLREHNQLLPYYVTMAEFMQRCVVVSNRVSIDSDHRTMLLLEAADFRTFSALNIERNFFTFLSNSSYIFRFFEELSAEMVPIEQLELADCYAEYEEHIAILTELYHRYQKLCDTHHVFEKIFVPDTYVLNRDYLKSLGSIVLHVEGYLTQWELSILQQCAACVELIVIYEANQFNRKLTSKFLALGVTLEEGYEYRINLKTLTILSQTEVEHTLEVATQPFSQRLLQVAYVKERIVNYVNSGIDVSRIVVVTPDETFSQMLHDFDDEGYFNFAKGIPLTHSMFYKALKASYDEADNSSVENRSRAERFGIHHHLKQVFHQAVKTVNFEALLEPFFRQEEDRRVMQIVHEECYRFTALIEQLQETTLKSALHLFLKRLAARSLDDVGGGKVTVMGLLETRMIPFEGVIIVDFNEGFVPRKSDKDLFLNSSVRQRSNLPTLQDREALQKLYYYNVMSRAKAVSISYVENAHSVPSRFLKELGISTAVSVNDDGYAGILFQRHIRPNNTVPEIEIAYDFTKEPLSASRLKMFLTCRRAFYYRYIQKLQGHEIRKDLPSEHEIGTVLHSVLKEVYTRQSQYDSYEELRNTIAHVFEKKITQNILHAYQLQLWLKQLEPFMKQEIARFHSGVEVLHCEASFQKALHGITLHGIIDRIDSSEAGIEILDYKSGAYTRYTKSGIDKAVDFQLEFYYLLYNSSAKRVAFYDLKTADIVAEPFLEEKLERLDEILQRLRRTTHITCDLTEDLSACRYCDYVHLCQRG